MTSSVLIIGGSGDLGQSLAQALAERGNRPVILDIRPPMLGRGEFIEGSVTELSDLEMAMTGIDAIVHIAGWHGIHKQQKSVYEFWDLNVTGTFYVLETAAKAGIRNIVYISSSSVLSEPASFYGQTKILGETVASGYVLRHGLNIIALRPRMFIPYWNPFFSSFVHWASQFWRWGVHINDVAQAVLRSLDLLSEHRLDDLATFVIDRAHEFSKEDLANWDYVGDGTTFRKYHPDYYDLALEHGLDPSQKPDAIGSAKAEAFLGYAPGYSLETMLDELGRYGPEGPPPPF